MKNLVQIAIAGVLLTLVVMGLTVVIKQAQIKKKEQIQFEATKAVYDQGVIKGSGYYTIEGVVRYTSHADIFLNEEYVQIVVVEDGKPASFKTEAGQWTGKVFRDSFTTVVVNTRTVTLNSSLRNISINLERKDVATR